MTGRLGSHLAQHLMLSPSGCVALRGHEIHLETHTMATIITSCTSGGSNRQDRINVTLEGLATCCTRSPERYVGMDSDVGLVGWQKRAFKHDLFSFSGPQHVPVGSRICNVIVVDMVLSIRHAFGFKNSNAPEKLVTCLCRRNPGVLAELD